MQQKAGATELTSPTSAAIVLNITGDDPKVWQIDVAGTKISVSEGETETGAPTLKAVTSDDVLLRIAARELNPVTAFFTGKIKLDGDVGLLSHLKLLLPDS